MDLKVLTINQEMDQLGEPEEFTWDLYPIVDSYQTLHLDENGLPKVGTKIEYGMIVVGRIGKTKSFDINNQPNSLEVHGLPREQVAAKYGHMWKDVSVYADEQTVGIVKKAYIERSATNLKAIVEIERKQS